MCWTFLSVCPLMTVPPHDLITCIARQLQTPPGANPPFRDLAQSSEVDSQFPSGHKLDTKPFLHAAGLNLSHRAVYTLISPDSCILIGSNGPAVQTYAIVSWWQIFGYVPTMWDISLLRWRIRSVTDSQGLIPSVCVGLRLASQEPDHWLIAWSQAIYDVYVPISVFWYDWHPTILTKGSKQHSTIGSSGKQQKQILL